MNLVSVIIPVKNRIELLIPTLKSILTQDYKQLEVILIDDHSEEDISLVINEVEDSRITLYKSTGTGPGAARNTGLKVAKGAYIKFFDSDDLMTSNAISCQVTVLEQSAADLVLSPFFKATLRDGKWEQLDEVMFYNYNGRGLDLDQQMIRGVFIPIPCFLFRRSVLGLKWVENYVNYEDWVYLWSLAKQKPKVVYENKSAFLYRIHGTQSTINNFKTSDRDREKLECLVPLLLRYDGSFFYKILAKGRIYQEIVTISDSKLRLRYQSYIKKSFQFCGYLYRLIAKLDRMSGGGIWGKLYGTSNDAEIYKKYIRLVTTEGLDRK